MEAGLHNFAKGLLTYQKCFEKICLTGIISIKKGWGLTTGKRNRLILLAILWVGLIYLIWPWIEQALPFSWTEKEFKMPGGTRSYYLYQPATIPEESRLPLYIFLMGFDLIEQPSYDTRTNYLKMAKFAEKHRAFIAFPRGMPGAFPENPGVRAWYPDYFNENRRFIASLSPTLWPKLSSSGNILMHDQAYAMNPWPFLNIQQVFQKMVHGFCCLLLPI